ncbi:MAG: IPTL-CTERM sorting domain-containing protein [Candidatus Competibacteraceae bacterium]|nr:IPTL-CTERM sorting domain-containing protein [Candidatus Competibacteraceae bacterium]
MFPTKAAAANGGYGGGSGNGLYGGGGAGLGGAIFIRQGTLNLSTVQFKGNTTQGGFSFATAGQAKGGAVFAITAASLANHNGSSQGLPVTLPTVTGCGNAFENNSADDAAAPDPAQNDTDNPDTFGASWAEVTATCDDGINLPILPVVPAEIPTLSNWALALLASCFGWLVWWRRRG